MHGFYAVGDNVENMFVNTTIAWGIFPRLEFVIYIGKEAW